ncbi:carbohydrate sulfotransferase 15-like [Mercenaria mercenaria]|uniref:carbohydrate sulfotransferase 15-like n=1 Tax=Mercenaria mercenaria TaxID=6596 RepID=UPI00234E4488|nr:carbohydrate sulfotransferase 15-like [Mercenaria mercenaria]
MYSITTYSQITTSVMGMQFCADMNNRLIGFVSVLVVISIVTAMVYLSFDDRHVYLTVRFNDDERNYAAAIEYNRKLLDEYNMKIDGKRYQNASLEIRRTVTENTKLNTCNFTTTEDMDLMKKKRLPFIERFKNPCWYEGKTLLCLPYMYLVGAAKCGTTDLYKKISKHPHFVKPRTKENNWLCDRRFFGNSSLSFYASYFFRMIRERLDRESGPSNLITGDATVFNLQGARRWKYLGQNIGKDEPVENTADYLYHLNSNTRILINVRNPVDRLWSEYLDLTRTREKSAQRFHEIVVRQVRLYNNCLKKRTLRSCMYDNDLSQLAMLSYEEVALKQERCTVMPTEIVMLRAGVYHVFIKDYLKTFPRDQVLIQRLEDIAADTEGSTRRTYKFLGFEMLSDDRMKQIVTMHIINGRKPGNLDKGQMFESTRRLLYEFYKPHNEQLSVLLNDAKYNYGPRD